MFASLLIANRGEIAVRIIRTAQRMGLRTIAIYSQADRDAPHVHLADEAHLVGPAPAAESYLSIERIMEAAALAGAQAIHPGYGFLAENASFAEACMEAGIVFVGPPPAAIRAMGLKDEAKALMERAGVPVVPGYHGPRQEPEFLREKAYEIGYPVLIKAVAGGGGKGMRRVDKVMDFEDALEGARREAEAAFGDGRVLIERYVQKPRHIEMQIFADSHGNAIHLFERDCSLQRRHQKIVEEAPAPGMSEDVRQAMGEAAISAARAVGYTNAGTVEFIVDSRKGLRPDGFFFMEMNTRLQVEHPVTEAVTGLDLVEWQLRVSAGEPLPLSQGGIRLNGHAVEARLYAEDPDSGFLPSTGTLEVLDLRKGDGIRIDSGVDEGGEVTPFYDPMIAKIIAHGATREEALERLSASLADSLVAGPRTNLGFLKRLVDEPDFRAGRFDTGLLEARIGTLLEHPRNFDEAAAAHGVLRLVEREAERIESARQLRSGESWSPWSAADGFQLGTARRCGIVLAVDGEVRNFELAWQDGEPAVVLQTDDGQWPEIDAHLVDSGSGVYVLAEGRQFHVAPRDSSAFEADAADGDEILRAPMHGRVVAVEVAENQSVGRGHKLAIIEAMKMEHTLLAGRDGTVAEITVASGDLVAQGQKILVIRQTTPEAG